MGYDYMCERCKRPMHLGKCQVDNQPEPAGLPRVVTDEALTNADEFSAVEIRGMSFVRVWENELEDVDPALLEAVAESTRRKVDFELRKALTGDGYIPYIVRRMRYGNDGYEVLKDGWPVASNFDTEDEAEQWIKDQEQR